MKCKECKQDKPLDSFYKSKNTLSGHDSYCKKCRNRRNNVWRKNNPEQTKLLNRKSQDKRRRELRVAAIAAYGGKCECCGEPEPMFLTLEHIDGVPETDRWKTGRRMNTIEILRRLEKEGWPKNGYTVLCMNCNWSKGIWGYCPHLVTPTKVAV